MRPFGVPSPSITWSECSPELRVTCDSCRLRDMSARGMLSSSRPISSALSVNARFDVLSSFCSPRVMYAVTTNITTKPITSKCQNAELTFFGSNSRNTAMIVATSTPPIGGLSGSNTKLHNYSAIMEIRTRYHHLRGSEEQADVSKCPSCLPQFSNASWTLNSTFSLQVYQSP